MEESGLLIGSVTCNLHHPPVLRVSSDAGDGYESGGDVDKAQDVIRGKALARADLDTQEVGRRQALPVSLQKRRLSGARPQIRV